MKKFLDNPYLGLFIGLLIPFVFGLLFLDSLHIPFNIVEILSFLHTPSLIVKFICVSLFPDMGLVYIFYSLDAWRSCRGIFSAIGIYTMAAIIVFFII